MVLMPGFWFFFMILSGFLAFFAFDDIKSQNRTCAMDIEKRIQAFAKLGEVLDDCLSPSSDPSPVAGKYREMLQNTVTQSEDHNPWFIRPFVFKTLETIRLSLRQEHLEKWVQSYPSLYENDIEPHTVGVVHAGNIPAVGFHDFLSVLVSGHIYYSKLSSKDPYLPKVLAEILWDIQPGFKEMIRFENHFLKQFDAVIATGSNNTARYFAYYFGKYPHIIRKNRNGVAVLTGSETDDELSKLADDLFLYFGLGCRNVSKLYLPMDFDPERLFSNMNRYQSLLDHSKYNNNYDYHKAMFIMNQVPHLDNGFLLLKEDKQIPSPIGTLHYERYHDLREVKDHLEKNRDKIQCVVTHSAYFQEGIDFGRTQYPALWDYADNADTLKFLLSLNH